MLSPRPAKGDDLQLLTLFAVITCSYEEVPDASHWFDGILSSPFVERFLAEHSPIESDRYPPVYPTEGFELVVANPDEQGSKRGFRITQLDRVGR